jgi:hypothetical protein
VIATLSPFQQARRLEFGLASPDGAGIHAKGFGHAGFAGPTDPGLTVGVVEEF